MCMGYCSLRYIHFTFEGDGPVIYEKCCHVSADSELLHSTSCMRLLRPDT